MQASYPNVYEAEQQAADKADYDYEVVTEIVTEKPEVVTEVYIEPVQIG